MSRKRIGKNVAYDTEKELYYAYFDGAVSYTHLTLPTKLEV